MKKKMRAIKFRAWDRTHNKMLDRVLAGPGDPCSIVWDADCKEWVNFDEACGDIMQFIGLHDANGREIYEGDIIEFLNPNTGKVLHYIVNWNNRDACFQFGDSGGWKFQSWLESVNGTMKIIGNMYENPGILSE